MLRRVDVVPKKSEKKFKVTSHVFLKIQLRFVTTFCVFHFQMVFSHLKFKAFKMFSKFSRYRDLVVFCKTTFWKFFTFLLHLLGRAKLSIVVEPKFLTLPKKQYIFRTTQITFQFKFLKQTLPLRIPNSLPSFFPQDLKTANLPFSLGQFILQAVTKKLCCSKYVIKNFKRD